jgi:hypothetical protein
MSRRSFLGVVSIKLPVLLMTLHRSKEVLMRRWRLKLSDRIAFNLVWVLVILIAVCAVALLRSCT